MYDCNYDSTPFVGWVGIMPLGGVIGSGDCEGLFPPIDP